MSSIQVSWYFTQDFGVKMKTKVHGTYVFIILLCVWKVMEKRQKKGQDLTNTDPLALCCWILSVGIFVRSFACCLCKYTFFRNVL